MKHPSSLVNDIVNSTRLILLAGLTGGVVCAVHAQIPGPGQFGGLGQGGAPTGQFPTNLRNMPPEERHGGQTQPGLTSTEQVPPDPRNSPFAPQGTAPGSMTGQTLDNRNVPLGQRDPRGNAMTGQFPADQRMAPMGQNPAYGGAGTGQAPGDLRSILGQRRAADAKKTPAGPKRTYGSATPGKARPESKDAAYEDKRTYGSATNQKGTSGPGDGSAGEKPTYSETKAGQAPSAAKDGARGERRPYGRETEGEVSSEAKEGSTSQRRAQDSIQRKRPSETENVPEADISRNVNDKRVPSGKNESPKDPYEGIKLGK